MGRNGSGIRLHFPEPRRIRDDRTSCARYRSRISYQELCGDRVDGLDICPSIRYREYITSATLVTDILNYSAFGPLLFAPLSEMYGRVRLLQSTNIIFLGGWNGPMWFDFEERRLSPIQPSI